MPSWEMESTTPNSTALVIPVAQRQPESKNLKRVSPEPLLQASAIRTTVQPAIG